jgi:transcriptional regulator with XRE-family HTH domain
MSFDLTTARLNAGFSIRGLARDLGIGEQAIRRLENGEVVHPATAKKVADKFGVRVTDLVSFGDPDGNDTPVAVAS